VVTLFRWRGFVIRAICEVAIRKVKIVIIQYFSANRRFFPLPQKNTLSFRMNPAKRDE
jgi:hypothetical protein